MVWLILTMSLLSAELEYLRFICNCRVIQEGLLASLLVVWNWRIEKKESIVTNIAASLRSEDELLLHEASFTHVSVHEISARKVPSDKRCKHFQHRAVLNRQLRE